MLHQGRMELESAKKTVEGVVDDVKAIGGIWDWFIGLFKQPDKPVEKKAEVVARKKQSYEELEVKLISDIGEKIGILFDTQQQIVNYYKSLEEDSQTNYNPEQNTSKKAIERALIELQIEKLMEQTREAMVYAPPELKDLYSRFLKMHQKIEREQEWARAETIRKTRLARWKQEQEEIELIGLVSSGVAVVFISMFFGWFMWQLRSWSTGY